MGIVHRDLKPANLFLTRRPDGSRSVKIIDFGISKIATFAPDGEPETFTESGAVFGTPHYMAPEQMRSTRDVDARADIWSLGAVLYGLLAGTPPFPGETIIEVYDSMLAGAPPLRVARPDAPARLEEIVLGCLQLDPAERYADVGELAAALAEVAPPEGLLAADRAVRVAGGLPPVNDSLDGMPAEGSEVTSSLTPSAPSSPPGTPQIEVVPPRETDDTWEPSWGRDGPTAPDPPPLPAAPKAAPEPPPAPKAPTDRRRPTTLVAVSALLFVTFVSVALWVVLVGGPGASSPGAPRPAVSPGPADRASAAPSALPPPGTSASPALGQAACGWAARDAIEMPGCPAVTISPDAAYDHAGCPHQYVVGYGRFESTARATVFWAGDLLTNASACRAAHLTLAAYTDNGGWGPPQITRMHGDWSASSSQPCRFSYDDGYAALDAIKPGIKHRLAASAYQLSASPATPTYAKVGIRMFVDEVCSPR
jgi:serine/threonine-protein kinase